MSDESIDHLKRLLDSLDSFKESIRKLEKEIENDQEQKNVSVKSKIIIPGKIKDVIIFLGIDTWILRHLSKYLNHCIML